MSDNEGVVSIRSLRDKQRGVVETDLIQVKESEWGRLHAELALKDQALDEIKALAQELRFVYSQVIEDEYERGHRHEEDDIKRRLQRVLTRLDTQGETK